MLTIGFTGSRDGMTDDQYRTVEALLTRALARSPELCGLHGDCVGADHDFHRICRQLGMPVLIRPCTFTSLRAYTDGLKVAEPVAPMQRNRAIVADADSMIATPPTAHELERSGTWATVRMTRKATKPLYLVSPDGTLEQP